MLTVSLDSLCCSENIFNSRDRLTGAGANIFERGLGLHLHLTLARFPFLLIQRLTDGSLIISRLKVRMLHHVLEGFDLGHLCGQANEIDARCAALCELLHTTNHVICETNLSITAVYRDTNNTKCLISHDFPLLDLVHVFTEHLATIDSLSLLVSIECVLTLNSDPHRSARRVTNEEPPSMHFSFLFVAEPISASQLLSI